MIWYFRGYPENHNLDEAETTKFEISNLEPYFTEKQKKNLFIQINESVF